MVEQGAEQKVLQPQEEEDQKNSLKEGEWKVAERRKETEAAWEKEQWRKGWEEGQRSDKAEELQGVVGRGEEEVYARESQPTTGRACEESAWRN